MAKQITKSSMCYGGVFEEAHRAYALRAVDELCWQRKRAWRDIPTQKANGAKSEEGAHAWDLSAAMFAREGTADGLKSRKEAHPPTEIGSSTPSGLTTLRKSTDDSPLALDTVVVFKYNTWRVDDPQAALELN